MIIISTSYTADPKVESELIIAIIEQFLILNKHTYFKVMLSNCYAMYHVNIK